MTSFDYTECERPDGSSLDRLFGFTSAFFSIGLALAYSWVSCIGWGALLLSFIFVFLFFFLFFAPPPPLAFIMANAYGAHKKATLVEQPLC